MYGYKVLCLLVLMGWPSSSRAILFYNTGDPAYNTNAPSGSLAGSGWQYEGQWSLFLGTAIAPRYFISAKHLGGTVGDVYSVDGVVYPTTAYFDHPQADLRIWRVRGSLPRSAELYARTNETGRAMVIFGRGTQRGDPVTVSSRYGHPLQGWLWGPSDNLQRWGENRVAAVVHDTGTDADALQMAFDGSGGANAAGLSGGDSGGAIFIQDGTTWKLAGINWAVDGPFNTNDVGGGFYATLFDTGGLYEWSVDQWVWQPELAVGQPGVFFATRISSYVAWIQQILSQPIPADPPVLVSTDRLNGLYTPEPAAVVDANTQTIRLTPATAPRFYRLEDAVSRQLDSIAFHDGALILTYR